MDESEAKMSKISKFIGNIHKNQIGELKWHKSPNVPKTLKETLEKP
jgi:hypothetical protein